MGVRIDAVGAAFDDFMRAFEAFNPDGSLKDPKQQATAQKIGEKLAGTLKKLLA